MKFVKIAGIHCSKVHDYLQPTENITTNLIRVLTNENPTEFECSIMDSIADNVPYNITVKNVVVAIPSIRIIPVERAEAAGIEYTELNDDERKIVNSIHVQIKAEALQYDNVKNQLDEIQSNITKFIDACDDKGHEDLIKHLQSWLEERMYSWTSSWSDSY